MVPCQSQADRDLGVEPRRIGLPTIGLPSNLREMQPICFRKRTCDARLGPVPICRTQAFSVGGDRLPQIRVRDLVPNVRSSATRVAGTRSAESNAGSLHIFVTAWRWLSRIFRNSACWRASRLRARVSTLTR